ncbi:MAG: hypothetical protein K0S65_2618, partial [Labilithrix sp.]|nr:hypothetical protein [Labilithrix sp.]
MKNVASTARPSRAHRVRRSGWLGVLLTAVLVACGEDGSARRGSLTLAVDPALVPTQTQIGERSVARMIGESGVEMDFYLGELILATNDQAKLDAFVTRWGGRILQSSEGAAGLTRIHQVALDPAAANVEQLLADVNAKAPDAHGAFRSSSDAASKLLSIALAEANAGGLTITPNFVVRPDGIAEGVTNEAPAGDDPLYSPNAFAWPYMSRGSAQNTGVGAAWQVMQRAGVLQNKVRIMILDGGFAPIADMPSTRLMLGDW